MLGGTYLTGVPVTRQPPSVSRCQPSHFRGSLVPFLSQVSQVTAAFGRGKRTTDVRMGVGCPLSGIQSSVSQHGLWANLSQSASGLSKATSRSEGPRLLGGACGSTAPAWDSPVHPRPERPRPCPKPEPWRKPSRCPPSPSPAPPRPGRAGPRVSGLRAPQFSARRTPAALGGQLPRAAARDPGGPSAPTFSASAVQVAAAGFPRRGEAAALCSLLFPSLLAGTQGPKGRRHSGAGGSWHRKRPKISFDTNLSLPVMLGCSL